MPPRRPRRPAAIQRARPALRNDASGRRSRAVEPSRNTGVRSVPATEAVRRFAALVDEVRRTGVSVVVTQHGRPVCYIAPPPTAGSTVESFVDALRSGPRADPELLDAIEAISRAQPRLPPSPWDE